LVVPHLPTRPRPASIWVPINALSTAARAELRAVPAWTCSNMFPDASIANFNKRFSHVLISEAKNFVTWVWRIARTQIPPHLPPLFTASQVTQTVMSAYSSASATTGGSCPCAHCSSRFTLIAICGRAFHSGNLPPNNLDTLSHPARCWRLKRAQTPLLDAAASTGRGEWRAATPPSTGSLGLMARTLLFLRGGTRDLTLGHHQHPALPTCADA